jgi:hypothetical protein
MEETSLVLHLELAMAVYGGKTWTLSKVDKKNTCKILKCVAGEGWRRSVGPTV